MKDAPEIFELIRDESSHIDWSERDISQALRITFPVPNNHARYTVIKRYQLLVTQLSNYHFTENSLVLCDEGVKDLLTDKLQAHNDLVFLNPTEDGLKTLSEVNLFVENHSQKAYSKVIVIGGGIMSNFGGYVAEQLGIDLVYVPTTIVAMSDASIGGKVRINDIQGNEFIKHAHKSFYEPSEIVLDPRFLDTLNDEQIRIGLAEVIKHAVYQSPRLAEYLLSDSFNPFVDKASLLRAILWTADLKRVCLEIDPEESKDGSYRILRAAHDISDKLEEKSGFTLPHGQAVEKAMVEDTHSDSEKNAILLKIYTKLGIGYTTIL